MTKIIPSIETLTGGTADTFVVCVGAGQVVSQKTASQARTLLSVSTTAEIAAAYQPIGSYAASVHTHSIADVTGLQTAIDGKQDTLVSGTNIKTINSTSLLGSGDITAGLSGTGSVDNAVLRADGTGGATLQSSLATISDLGAITLPAIAYNSRSITLGSNFGWAVNSGIQLWLHVNGNYVSVTTDSQVSYRGGVHITFASNASFPANGDDVGLIRHATSTLRVSNASSGYGNLIAGTGEFVAQSASVIPLTVKGAASQSGNLTEWKNSAGTTLASINSSGRLGMNDPYGTPHRFSFEQRALLLRYNDSVTGFASFNGNTAINGSGLGLGICNGSPDYSVFSNTNSLKLGNICVSSNAIPTAPPSGASFRIVNNTLQRNDTFFIAASPVGGTNNERQDGIHVMIAGSSGLIAGTAAAANGGSVFIALGAAAGSGVPGSFEVRTLAGAAKFQVDGNTTSGETPLLLLDLASGTMKRVSIGAADSGGTGFKVLRVPN